MAREVKLSERLFDLIKYFANLRGGSDRADFRWNGHFFRVEDGEWGRNDLHIFSVPLGSVGIRGYLSGKILKPTIDLTERAQKRELKLLEEILWSMRNEREVQDKLRKDLK